MNFLVAFVWCVFFAVVAGRFIQGIPLFVLLVINGIGASIMLLPKTRNNE